MSPRVASLLPSATEIVCALGGIDLLCGVSHECDYPPELAARVASGALPVLTGARLGPPGALEPAASDPAAQPTGEAQPSSAQIDAELRRLVAQALSVYVVDEQALADCRPDVILTQDLCAVCAVSYAETCRAASHLTHATRVVSSHPRTLADIFADIERLATAIGRPAAAAPLLDSLRARVEAVRRTVSASGSARPRVLTLEWIDPPMPGGLWMAELIELAGGEPLLDQAGEHTRALNMDELGGVNPEVLVVKPCGFTLERGLAELAALRAAVPWERWDACRTGRVFIADGSAYFNRPGPRIVDSLELLVQCINPVDLSKNKSHFSGLYARISPDESVERY